MKRTGFVVALCVVFIVVLTSCEPPLRPAGGAAGASRGAVGQEKPQQANLGDPLPGLSPEQVASFEAGKLVFERVFTPQDGLGPLFNANGCGECHESPVLGGVGDEVEVHATKFIAETNTCDPLIAEGGFVIQLQALGTSKEQIPDDATGVGHRSTPPLFGFGLIDGIPDRTILANEDPNDADGDGISGRANLTTDGRVGKFGRKASVATLFEFNAGAFINEIGVTTPLNPTENTINGIAIPPFGNLDPPSPDLARDPEIQLSGIEAVTNFLRFLAPPPDVSVEGVQEKKLVHQGEKLFKDIQCAKCHIPSMRTGGSDIKALNHKEVSLYSDLLLHDMGQDLADICLGLATPDEFRTEMLMGLHSRTHFLHDGSAVTVREAIERHAGEASGARQGFVSLTEEDKQALLEFLMTI